MFGKVSIGVTQGKVTYNIELRRAITIIRGDSATGKTYLCRLISDANKPTSVIKIRTNAKGVYTVTDETYLLYKDKIDCVFFVDEDSTFYRHDDFDFGRNYYVIITRTNTLPKSITFSVDEVYEFESICKKTVETSMVKLYENTLQNIIPDVIVTEGQGSDYTFISSLVKCKVKPAGGRDNIANVLDTISRNKLVYVIIDGAGGGSAIQKIVNAMSQRRGYIFVPESFEYMLLSTDDISRYLGDELEYTENYANEGYKSWEGYFTELLSQICEKYLGKVRYDKGHLDTWFLRDNIKGDVKDQLNDLNYRVFK